MLLNRVCQFPLASRPRSHVVAAMKVDKSKKQPPAKVEPGADKLKQALVIPAAAALAAALVTSAIVPEEAMAARSGGRIGGSAFRSAPRSMPRGGGSRIQNNYYGGGLMAPPLMGGGYGYGYGGFMPSLFFPIGFGGGGIIQLFITLFVISSVLNAIKSIQQRKDEDDFDDFD